MGSLLAVDLGLRTGFALYGQDGRLSWHRSKNYGTAARLRRGVHSVLKDIPDISLLVLEGGGAIAAIWEHEAAKLDLSVKRISAEKWRQKLLYPREQLSGPEAKRYAGSLARRIIKWSRVPSPPALRHDAAEAILIGFWAVMEAGWLKQVPRELNR